MNHQIYLRSHYFLYLYLFLALFSIFALSFRTILSQQSNSSHHISHIIYDRNNNILAYEDFRYDVYLDTAICSKLTLLKLGLEKIPENGQKKILVYKNIKLDNEKKYKDPAIQLIKHRVRIYTHGPEFYTIGTYNERKGLCKGVELIAKKSSVVTTIDKNMQKILFNILEKAKEEFDAQEAYAVIMNMDGEIEAMHTTKSNKNGEMCDFINIYHSIFEFGSSSKAYTFLYGFHKNIINEESIFEIKNGVYIDNRPMRDEERISDFAHPEEIFKHSSNIGTILIGKMFDDEFVDFLKSLKLHESIDFLFTKTAMPMFPNKWTTGDRLTMCLGYCYATTAFNMLRAYLAILNKGLLINPTLIKNNHSDSGRIPLNNLHKLYRLLQVNAARHPILGQYKCASKTGTAKVMGSKTYTNDVNTNIICALPDINGKYKYLILVGLLRPNPPVLAGLCVRKMCVQIVQKIFPNTFYKTPKNSISFLDYLLIKIEEIYYNFKNTQKKYK